MFLRVKKVQENTAQAVIPDLFGANSPKYQTAVTIQIAAERFWKIALDHGRRFKSGKSSLLPEVRPVSL